MRREESFGIKPGPPLERELERADPVKDETLEADRRRGAEMGSRRCLRWPGEEMTGGEAGGERVGFRSPRTGEEARERRSAVGFGRRGEKGAAMGRGNGVPSFLPEEVEEKRVIPPHLLLGLRSCLFSWKPLPLLPSFSAAGDVPFILFLGDPSRFGSVPFASVWNRAHTLFRFMLRFILHESRTLARSPRSRNSTTIYYIIEVTESARDERSRNHVFDTDLKAS
ncbi:hypothetical protein BHE74_00014843 [Ensete ventricosum]|nr:hypothetical protein BHE74_00014843 [Ensete ventricosum]